MRQIILFTCLFLGASCRAPRPQAPPSPQTMTIPFEARVGTEPFACGRQYSNMGSTRTNYQPQDLRLYVHNVRLVTKDQREVPVVLSADAFQGGGIALLDFEDGSGLCSNGTKEKHTGIVGAVPAGDYQGLRFEVGVPEAMNHQDASLAEAPLNELGLFWSWNMGYLFTKIEGITTGLPQGYTLHLGSTGCAPVSESTPNQFTCKNKNMVQVDLPSFVPSKNKVVLDLASLFEKIDLDHNTPDTALGCMSFPEDPDCAAVFAQLGLPFKDTKPASNKSSLFRVE